MPGCPARRRSAPASVSAATADPPGESGRGAEPRELLGAVFHVDALRACDRILARELREGALPVRKGTLQNGSAGRKPSVRCMRRGIGATGFWCAIWRTQPATRPAQSLMPANR